MPFGAKYADGAIGRNVWRIYVVYYAGVCLSRLPPSAREQTATSRRADGAPALVAVVSARDARYTSRRRLRCLVARMRTRYARHMRMAGGEGTMSAGRRQE